jgi:hypothetical protein
VTVPGVDRHPMDTGAVTTGTRPRKAATARSWIERAAPSVVGGWLAARLALIVSFVLAEALAPHVTLPYGRAKLDEGLMAWDGQYYRAIAELGYAHADPDAVRFFPAYPLLGRWLSALMGHRTDIALLLIANLAALGAGFAVWRLVRDLGLPERTAGRAAVLMAIFPAASALGFAYAEPLFLLLFCIGAAAIVRGQPGRAVLPFVALGLLRPTGVLVAAPAFIAAVGAARSWKAGRVDAVGRVISWCSAVAAPLVGLGAYLLWLEETTGDGSAPLEWQRKFRNGFREPITRLFSAIGDIATGDFRQAYNIALALVLIVGTVLAVRRIAWAWIGYAAVGLAVALAANNIDSLGRYGLMLVPAWAVGYAETFRRRDVWAAICGLSTLGFVWYTTLVWLGQVVP